MMLVSCLWFLLRCPGTSAKAQTVWVETTLGYRIPIHALHMEGHAIDVDPPWSWVAEQWTVHGMHSFLFNDQLNIAKIIKCNVRVFAVSLFIALSWHHAKPFQIPFLNRVCHTYYPVPEYVKVQNDTSMWMDISLSLVSLQEWGLKFGTSLRMKTMNNHENLPHPSFK